LIPIVESLKPELEPEPVEELEVAKGPATFSDAPTRPLSGIPTSHVEVQPQPRAAARTMSINVGRRRRLLAWALVAAAAVAVAIFSHEAAEQAVAQPQRNAPLQLPKPEREEPLPEPPAPAAAQPAAIDIETGSAMAPAISSTEAGAPKRAVAPVDGDGLLSINTRPWSTVYLGKRVLGTTPIASVKVPRGPITLKLVDRDGHVHTRKLDRSNGKTRSVFFDFEAPGPR
jgi:hypothetical protein